MFYDELNKSSKFLNNLPNAEECKKNWSDNWWVGKAHNRTAVWLEALKKEIDHERNRYETQTS